MVQQLREIPLPQHLVHAHRHAVGKVQTAAGVPHGHPDAVLLIFRKQRLRQPGVLAAEHQISPVWVPVSYTHLFQMKDGAVKALQNINLTIPDGAIYGIIGMSGAGKSTLVRCINLLERPTGGSVVIDGVAMETLSPASLRKRRREITMIFQQFNLLMQRTCLKNVCFPMELAGVKKAEAEKRAMELLEMVGLPDKANAYPAQLSGGQKQRIAIARALATNPKVLLCDEATSALDPNTTHSILTLIKDINRKLGITVVVITHQMSVVEEICDSVAILDGGMVVEQGSVQEIFANPKTAAAKRLVAPNGGSAARDLSCFAPDDHVVRVTFNLSLIHI